MPANLPAVCYEMSLVEQTGHKAEEDVHNPIYLGLLFFGGCIYLGLLFVGGGGGQLRLVGWEW